MWRHEVLSMAPEYAKMAGRSGRLSNRVLQARPMKNLICLIAIVAQGCFSGAMLLVAAAIVPGWYALASLDYRVSFQALGPYIGQYMIPLMLASILLPAAGAYVDKPHRRQWVVAAVLVGIIVPLYGIFSAPVNDLLLGNVPLSDQEIISNRAKWSFWHGVRTVLGTSAFCVSLKGRVS